MSILAIDHRQNLRRLFGVAGDDRSLDAAIGEFKQAVVRALAPEATAVLLDPEIGLRPCVEAGCIPDDVGIVAALEATGYDGPPFARVSRLVEGWGVEAARGAGAAAVKLLLYYHPASPTAEAQERLLELVSADAGRAGLPLFVEVLVHSPDPTVTLGDADRRRAIVGGATRLAGVGGDVFKVEFPATGIVDDGSWADACAELSEAVGRPWVLLSGGAPWRSFLEQATIACRAGASGVAAGRSIWGGAVGLAPDHRDAFLATEARARLADLVAVVEREARPWTEVAPVGMLRS